MDASNTQEERPARPAPKRSGTLCIGRHLHERLLFMTAEGEIEVRVATVPGRDLRLGVLAHGPLGAAVVGHRPPQGGLGPLQLWQQAVAAAVAHRDPAVATSMDNVMYIGTTR